VSSWIWIPAFAGMTNDEFRALILSGDRSNSPALLYGHLYTNKPSPICATIALAANMSQRKNPVVTTRSALARIM